MQNGFSIAKVCLLLHFLLLSIPSYSSENLTRTQILMGDVPVSITVKTNPKKKALLAALLAIEEAFSTVRKLEKEISEWGPESQTTLLNQNAGLAFVPIGRHLIKILEEARQISELTQGAFDVTFASPDKSINYQRIILIPELGLAYLPKGAKIAVSGIAKGYIVDRMSDVLRKRGFRRFLVDAGDLYASGAWTVGIRDPNHPSSERSICKIKVKDRAISTSGTYERGFHIVDPLFHKQARGFKSMTVISKQSVFSDALATGLFVLASRGQIELGNLLRQYPHVGIILIDEDEQGGVKTWGGYLTAGRVSGCR